MFSKGLSQPCHPFYEFIGFLGATVFLFRPIRWPHMEKSFNRKPQIDTNETLVRKQPAMRVERVVPFAYWPHDDDKFESNASGIKCVIPDNSNFNDNSRILMLYMVRRKLIKCANAIPFKVTRYSVSNNAKWWFPMNWLAFHWTCKIILLGMIASHNTIRTRMGQFVRSGRKCKMTSIFQIFGVIWTIVRLYLELPVPQNSRF